MKNTEYACYVLIASAFVLGAVVLMQVNSRFELENQAHAEMLIDRGLFTVLSTQGRNTTEEFIYVLDTRQSVLVCYYHNPSSNQLEVFGTMNIAEAIQLAQRKFGSAPPRGGSGR